MSLLVGLGCLHFIFLHFYIFIILEIIFIYTIGSLLYNVHILGARSGGQQSVVESYYCLVFYNSFLAAESTQYI